MKRDAIMKREVIRKRVKEGLNNSKLIPIIIIISIIGFLFATSPAYALFSKLIVNDGSNIVTKGEIINLNTIVDLEENNINEIEYLNFIFKGPLIVPRDFQCSFYVNGTIKSNTENCKGIDIRLIKGNSYSPGYSYGYPDNKNCFNGYGYDSNCLLNYSIKIDSSKYYSGEYEAKVVVVLKDKKIETNKEKIVINSEDISDFQRCSVRAYDGSLILLNKTYTNNKLSFYVSTDLDSNKVKGKGSLYGQKGRERFSYRFDIIDVLENNENSAVLYISGDYKVGPKGKNNEKAILYFDKINNKITLAGETLYIKTLYINFRKDC
jgi:hypothetical protein